MEHDQREICTLRDLKEIVDRDKAMLQGQVNQLLREKDDLIAQIDSSSVDIKTVFKEKQDIQGENFRLNEEIQNMRFMIQDKESLIKRLEFKLNRAQNDQGTNVIRDYNDQID